AETRSNEGGHFLFKDIPPKRHYWFFVEMDGYWLAGADMPYGLYQSVLNNISDLRLQVRKTGGFTGYLLTPQGKELTNFSFGCNIEYSPDKNTGSTVYNRSRTRSDGSFFIPTKFLYESLPPETDSRSEIELTIIFLHNDYANTPIPASLTSQNDIVNLGRINYQAGYSINGIVRNDKCEPIWKASISVMPGSKITSTGKDGRFHMEGLRYEYEVIVIKHDQYAPQIMDTICNKQAKEITLKPGMAISGSVKTVQGVPFPDVTVVGRATLVCSSRKTHFTKEATTDENGQYILTNMPEGKIKLKVREAGSFHYYFESPEDASREVEAGSQNINFIAHNKYAVKLKICDVTTRKEVDQSKSVYVTIINSTIGTTGGDIIDIYLKPGINKVVITAESYQRKDVELVPFENKTDQVFNIYLEKE
ncbi:hypothetical protein ACFL54_09735, partial [Planctomycetota bacterium]